MKSQITDLTFSNPFLACSHSSLRGTILDIRSIYDVAGLELQCLQCLQQAPPNIVQSQSQAGRERLSENPLNFCLVRSYPMTHVRHREQARPSTPGYFILHLTPSRLTPSHLTPSHHCKSDLVFSTLSFSSTLVESFV